MSSKSNRNVNCTYILISNILSSCLIYIVNGYNNQIPTLESYFSLVAIRKCPCKVRKPSALHSHTLSLISTN